MAGEKHHVFSARTTEEGLRLLNELRAKLGIGWDELVVDAVCAHYGLDRAVLEVPPKPVDEAKARAKAEKAEAKAKTEREAKAKSKVEAKAKKKAKAANKAPEGEILISPPPGEETQEETAPEGEILVSPPPEKTS